jgi:threonine dehydrogenase-like Zn-dependent dehydrogenase
MPAPSGLSAEQLTIFEPLANAVNWVRTLGIGWGDAVVIQGPGHQGLLCAAAARAFGATQVIVTGTAEDQLRLDAARRLGATATVVVDDEDLAAQIGGLTEGRMADVVLDVCPNPVTASAAMDLASFRGRIGLAGLKHFQPVQHFLSDLIVLKSLTVSGLAGSTPASMEEAVRLIGERPEIAQEMSGAQVELDSLDRGLALLERRLPGEDAIHVALVHRSGELDSDG